MMMYIILSPFLSLTKTINNQSAYNTYSNILETLEEELKMSLFHSLVNSLADFVYIHVLKQTFISVTANAVLAFLAGFFKENFRLIDWCWLVLQVGGQAASTIRLKFWIKFCFLKITQMFLNGID